MNQAIKDWGRVLAPDFSMDRATFILASLIPFSVDYYDTENSGRIIVEYKTLNRISRRVDKAVHILVTSGVAKSNSTEITLGYIENGKRRYLYENRTQVMLEEAENSEQYKQDFKQDESMEFEKNILRQKLANYHEAAVRLHKASVYNKVKDNLMLNINRLYKASTSTVTATSVLHLFEAVKALYYEDFNPNFTQKANIKNGKYIRELIDSTEPTAIISMAVVLFEYFDNYAGQYKDPNVFHLCFNRNRLLADIRRRHNGKAESSTKETFI